MSCTKSHLKKYATRPGPPYPAQQCRPGTVRAGNDGKRYHNTPDKNGRLTWKALSKEKSIRKSAGKKSTKKSAKKSTREAAGKKNTVKKWSGKKGVTPSAKEPLFAQLGIPRTTYFAVRRMLLDSDNERDSPARKWSRTQYQLISDVVNLVLSPRSGKAPVWEDYLARKRDYAAAFRNARKQSK